MAFDVYITTHTIPTPTQACHFKYHRVFSSLDDYYFAGDEIIRTNKRNEEDTKETRSRIPSHTTSTIAEEAVDQLQASEKLIAGN